LAAPVANLAEALGSYLATIERHAVDSETAYARYVAAVPHDVILDHQSAGR
jgi:hypothetical protein